MPVYMIFHVEEYKIDAFKRRLGEVLGRHEGCQVDISYTKSMGDINQTLVYLTLKVPSSEYAKNSSANYLHLADDILTSLHDYAPSFSGEPTN